MPKFLSKRIALLLTVFALALTACGAAPATAQRPPLKVGWVLWGGWYPILIAQEKGFFEKHGVQVEPVYYDIYSEIPGDFASQKLDGALFALFDILPLESQKINSGDRVVMITDNSFGADAIVAKAEIATPADLKGKRLGVKIGSYAQVLIMKMLEASGLSLTDVKLVDILPERAAEALAEDQVDAVHSYEPYVTQATRQGYHTIYSSVDTPGLIANVLAFQASVIRDRPEDVRAFIDAWFEAQSYWLQHPEEGNGIIARLTGQNPEDISYAGIALYTLDDNLNAFQTGTDTTSLYYSAQINLDFLINSGTISVAPNLNVLLDPAFLQ
jgi:NitT/TauT family transport system substrate-binding protein